MKEKFANGASWVQIIGLIVVLLLVEIAPVAQTHFALMWGTIWVFVGLIGLVERSLEEGARRQINTLELLLAFGLLYAGYSIPYITGAPAWYTVIGEKLLFFEPFYLYHFTFLIVISLEVVQILFPSAKAEEEKEEEEEEEKEEEEEEEAKRKKKKKKH